MKKNMIFISIVSIIGVMTLLFLKILPSHYKYTQTLKPQLLITIPLSECDAFNIKDYDGDTYTGMDLYIYCRSKNFTGPFFALRGKKAVRFMPAEYRSVYGYLKTEQADSGIVYVYKYNDLYHNMIFMESR